MLTTQSLSCRRGRRLVFQDIVFTAEAGGFVLVTGPNGSGKSSLLRILAGLLEPASGQLFWNHTDIARDKAAHHARLHYIGHLDAVKPELSVMEMCCYWQAMRGIPQTDAAQMLDAFGLSRLSSRAVRTLSAGQKRRLSLARLAFDAAPLWLLDEPTTALDKEGQGLLWEHIARHRAKGGIVIAAMHDEAEIKDVQRITMGGA